MKKQIPNILTCCNLICGCIATWAGFMSSILPGSEGNPLYGARFAFYFILLGAVFDFFAGTLERAPLAWQQAGYEWLYRLLKEPKRMWRRYIIGNTEFLYLMFREWAKF